MNFNSETDLAPANPVADGAISQETAGAPYGGDEFTADPGLDPLAGATAGRKLSGGTIIIIAVILSAVAGLLSMRKLAEVTAAPAIDAEIEKTIDSFFKKVDPAAGTPPTRSIASIDTVLGVLTETYSERQVPLQDVQRDPFIISEAQTMETPETPVLITENDGSKAAREYARKKAEQKDKMMAAADRIVVKSIMGGSRPMALIGGQIRSVGDVVTAKNNDTEFTIEAISTGSVDLVAESPEYELTIRTTVFLQRDR